MEDHTECLEIDFDQTIISFEKIVRHFWDSHNPNRGTYKGRQYLSIFLYRNEEQKQALLDVKKTLEYTSNKMIETEIVPFKVFTIAEDRHQKYYLKRYHHAMEQLYSYFTTHDTFNDSTLAARLNSFVKGYGSLSGLTIEMKDWELDKVQRERLSELIRKIRW